MAHSQSQYSDTRSAAAASRHHSSDHRNSSHFGPGSDRSILPAVYHRIGSDCTEAGVGSSGCSGCTSVRYRHLERDMSIQCRSMVGDQPFCVVVGKYIC